MKELFDHYMADFMGIGVACDAARMLINYDVGGLYLDMDAYYPQYSAEAHYLFDFWGYHDVEFYERYLATWSFGSKPGHPVHKMHLKYLRKHFSTPAAERPFFLNRCYFPTAGVVLFLTGPFYYTVMAHNTLASPFDSDSENQDIFLMNSSYTNITENLVTVQELNGEIVQKVLNLEIR